ncbi:MAG: hypothetical protein KF735_07055 [Chelatococcus sp.]|uniref:hypothetical protein n=1 Tax=Chelatococcus sp. TaxID=1953771 RepID=UPI0025BCDE0F|nr:hypothetical protein [Chelatococcus sp.]MBX3537375.1 hypothetical protein [Chelatococcus sp.]
MASPTADEAADMRRRRAEGASIAGIMVATGWGRTAVRNALASTPEMPVEIPGRAGLSAEGRTRRNAKTKAKPSKGTKPKALTDLRPKVAKARSRADPKPGPEVETKTRSEKTRSKTAPARSSLVARLWRTADAQVRAVERRLAEGETEPGEREKDARTLAVVVKTLRDLLALEAGEQTVDATTAKEKGGDVRDLDDFRRELAERIDRLRRARDADVPAGEL